MLRRWQRAQQAEARLHQQPCQTLKLSFTCLQEQHAEIEADRPRTPAAEAPSKEIGKTTCSHCGQLGHNKRRCPELAQERQQEEEQKLRKQRGPLWGLAGVEEQRMPGGRKPVLVFPVPLQVQDTVNQVCHDSPSPNIIVCCHSTLL